MRTEDLASLLATELTPRPYRSTALAAFAWLATTLAVLFLSSKILGTRDDIFAKFDSPRYLFEFFSVLLCWGLAGGGALLLSLPGRVRVARFAPALGGAVSLWVGGLAALFVLDLRGGAATKLDSFASGLPCTITTFAVALVPAAVLWWFVRSRAPTRPGWNALAIGLSAYAVGALALLLHCPVDAVSHHLVWHAAPVFVACLGASLLGHRLLPW